MFSFIVCLGGVLPRVYIFLFLLYAFEKTKRANKTDRQDYIQTGHNPAIKYSMENFFSPSIFQRLQSQKLPSNATSFLETRPKKKRRKKKRRARHHSLALPRKKLKLYIFRSE